MKMNSPSAGAMRAAVAIDSQIAAVVSVINVTGMNAKKRKWATKKMKLKDQNRQGINQYMTLLGGGIPVNARMTIPAREALRKVSVVKNNHFYFSRPPQDMISVLVRAMDGYGYEQAFRLTIEPPYPNEMPDDNMWTEAMLTPCPKCGAALVWWEAGYVPGYRVCAGPKHHHYIVT